MAHEVYWIKENRLLYASYIGHQTVSTIMACLDDMAQELDKVDKPVFVLINWLEVTEMDAGALLKTQGHRAFSHPMAARGILVGFDKQAGFENQVSANRTRGESNTIYFKTIDEANSYLKSFIED